MSKMKAALFPWCALVACAIGSCEEGKRPWCAECVDPQVDWVEIPAGSFTFGSPDGTPCRGLYTEKEVPVTLTRPFLMSKYEITQKQWKALGFTVPHNAPACDGCPVTVIDQFEAMAWCNALSRFEGLEQCYDLSRCTGTIGSGCADLWDGSCGVADGVTSGPPVPPGNYYCEGPVRRHASMYDCAGYRLPTGPEWEYAAKAGTTTNTYAGDVTSQEGGCVEEPVLEGIAWYCFNSGDGYSEGSAESLNYLWEVGLKQPNQFGLHDMLGNASEWVDYVSTGFSLDANEDKWDQALVDPMGTTEDDDERRDIRGGNFHKRGCYSRSADQFQTSGYDRQAPFGFRPVRTIAEGSSAGGRAK